MASMCFIVTTSIQNFTVMHYTVFEQLDTFSFAFLVCKILYIDGKQFRCSVLTFVQYTIFFSRDAKGSSGI